MEGATTAFAAQVENNKYIDIISFTVNLCDVYKETLKNCFHLNQRTLFLTAHQVHNHMHNNGYQNHLNHDILCRSLVQGH